MDEFDLDRRDMEEQKFPELDSPVEYDAAAEARVRRKLDWNLMPLFFVLCKQRLLFDLGKAAHLTSYLRYDSLS